MPGASGLEVAIKLRREIPSAKIIIMSHHDQTRLLPRALAAGADAWVDKLDLGTGLLPTIENVIGNSDANLSTDAG